MKDDYLKKFFRQVDEKGIIQKAVMQGYDANLSISIIECPTVLDGYEVAEDYIFG